MSRLIPVYEAKAMFDEFLDEVNGEVSIGTLRYAASDVLKSVDPVLYDMEFSEYTDRLVEDGVYVEGYTDELLEN